MLRVWLFDKEKAGTEKCFRHFVWVLVICGGEGMETFVL